MREAHVTFDPRTGMFDPQPLRTFTVWRDEARDLPPIEVKAHSANTLDNGQLAFFQFIGGLPFTVQAFAAGKWAGYAGSMPSHDEVRQIKVFTEREQAINNMLMHDAKVTRQ